MKDKLEGKAEELRGNLTGDKPEEVEGNLRQGLADTKQTGAELPGDMEEGANTAEQSAGHVIPRAAG